MIEMDAIEIDVSACDGEGRGSRKARKKGLALLLPRPLKDTRPLCCFDPFSSFFFFSSFFIHCHVITTKWRPKNTNLIFSIEKKEHFSSSCRRKFVKTHTRRTSLKT